MIAINWLKTNLLEQLNLHSTAIIDCVLNEYKFSVNFPKNCGVRVLKTVEYE